MDTKLPEFKYSKANKAWNVIANSSKSVYISIPYGTKNEELINYYIEYRGGFYRMSGLHMEYDSARDELIFKTNEYNRDFIINSSTIENVNGYIGMKFLYSSGLTEAGMKIFFKSFYTEISEWFKNNKSIVLKGFEIEKLKAFISKKESLEEKKRELEIEIAKIEKELSEMAE